MDIIYYIFLFVALYFQIFFLVGYLEHFDFFNPKKNQVEKYIFDFSPSRLPNISLIVACWNEEETIDATVQSIFASDYPREKIQLILVNDGSTDSTWDRMQEYISDPQVLCLDKENGGKFTAINDALIHTTGELIATVDADTHLDKKAINYMVAKFP